MEKKSVKHEIFLKNDTIYFLNNNLICERVILQTKIIFEYDNPVDKVAYYEVLDHSEKNKIWVIEFDCHETVNKLVEHLKQLYNDGV
jgi:hypothetical protein